MNKKIIIASVLALAAAMAVTAFAQTVPATTTVAATPSPAVHPQPMVLQIGAAGRVLMRGTIASVSAGSLTVTSWGGVWTVNVGSGAQVLPQAAGSDITQFKMGDFVGVAGTVSQSAPWTIDATLVRDWTYRQAVSQERQQNVQSARETMQSGTPRNYVGTSSNVSGTSLTLTTANGTSYAVNVASNVEVVNRNWVTLPLSSIQANDSVHVWGVNASGTITAQIVRDLSIPAVATSSNALYHPSQ